MVSHEKVKVSWLPLPAAASVREVIVSTADEITIDELAARVGMTVRNVRAYAGRGLIPAPRLQGRTGYYGAEHVSRLRLIRELVDRGYTLAAVEKAFASQSESTAVHALDLLAVLDAPLGQETAEVMRRDSLPMLTGSGPGTGTDVVDDLVRLGLAEVLDDDRINVLHPSVVRAGTSAIALGLSPSTVTSLMPLLSDRLGDIADELVTRVREEIWQPFKSGMPEQDWPHVLNVIEQLLLVAGQAVIAAFRRELNRAIESALGAEIAAMGPQ